MCEPTVINFDDLMKKKGKKKTGIELMRHAEFLPDNPFLGLVVGKSGSGKTNLIMNLIMQRYLVFTRIIVYSKTLDQPKLKYLRDTIMACKEATDGLVDGIFVSEEKDLPLPQELDKSQRFLLLLDDILEERQDSKISMYFTRGRHVNCSVIFAAQSYFNVRKSAIRSNANYIILHRGISKSDIDNIARTNAPDLTIPEFRKFYITGTKEPRSFVVMHLELSIEDGAYRWGFCTIVDPRTL